MINDIQYYLFTFSAALSTSFWFKNGRRLLVTVPFLVPISVNHCALRNDVREVDGIIRVKAVSIELFISYNYTSKNQMQRTTLETRYLGITEYFVLLQVYVLSMQL